MTNVLDSRGLSLFLAVADTLSFRQAAERLHMSQPPLSRAIRTLEERLGTRLFVRDTHVVSLTDAGKQLVPRARKILMLLDEAEAAMTAVDVPTRLRIGVTNAVEPGWFKGLATRIEGAQAASSVETVSSSSPKLVRLLRARKLDAAFVALPTETAGLRLSALDQQPMIVAMPTSHRLARRRTVALKDLANEGVYWFERSRQPAFFDHCRNVFERHAFAPRTIREPEDHHVLLAGIASGQGVALLPRSFSSLKLAGVSYRALKEGEELAVSIGLVTLPDAAGLHAMLVAWALAQIGSLD